VWALAHNHVLHGENTRDGVNKFRYLWVADPSGWSICDCGWQPDWGLHNSKRPDQKLLRRVRSSVGRDNR
jgi:hypothetical protein